MGSASRRLAERPTEKIGLDNLGTQQPCIAIYSRLLPGVTNVTDRASYSDFYPWFLRAFEQRFPMLPIQNSGLLCAEPMSFHSRR